MCHHLLNQLAWNVQHMDMTIGSPNNDEHVIPKVYGDTASRRNSILLLFFRVLNTKRMPHYT
uniref:Uncharacterized protein n=1 Tax=Arundo donax TaxID=35708 RepID=A0A0A9HF61_ARUDO